MSAITVKVPLFTPVMRNVDEETLSDKSYALIDGYTDNEGYSVRRPGLLSFCDLGLGVNRSVDGLFYWSHKDCALAVSNGQIFKITLSGTTPTVTDLTGDALSAGQQVTFATNGTYAFLANGGRIVYTDGTTATAYIADADCPTTVSHVGFVDGYILANLVGTKRFNFSDSSNPLTWAALDLAQVVGDADNLTAFTILNGEIYFFGPASIEIWEDDGSTPFARVPGGFLQSGLGAIYSVISSHESVFWMDDERNFAKFEGRSMSRISTPYDRDIQSFSTISDCIGFKIEIVGQQFLVFCFPTAERTLVYNIAKDDWAEWRYYDTTLADYRRWLGNCHCFVSTWGKHLVGSRKESVIYVMSQDYHTDDGAIIRMLRRSGHIDYGTSKLKRNNEFRIRAKRGAADTSTTPKLMVRWRDNGRYWSQERQLSLGNPGETDLVMRLFRTGFYRTRQYEISATDAVPIVYGAAEEDIEVLR